MQKIKCPLCNSNKEEFLFNVGKWGKNYRAVKCNSCGFVFINPQPSKEEIEEHYNKNYDYSYMFKRKLSKNDLKDVKSIKKIKKGRLLDVGCGTGLFILAAKKNGLNVFGIDLSEKVVEYGKNKFNLDLKNKDFLKQKGKFDLITMRYLLEHTTDPRKYIKKTSKLLDGGGLLFLKLPNINSFSSKLCKEYWEWMSPPAHLMFFSPKKISKLLFEEGFKILKIETRRGDAGSLFLNFLVTFSKKMNFARKLRKRSNNIKKNKNLSSLVKIANFLNFFLFPLEYILNKRGKGPEMVVYAIKK